MQSNAELSQWTYSEVESDLSTLLLDLGEEAGLFVGGELVGQRRRGGET